MNPHQKRRAHWLLGSVAVAMLSTGLAGCVSLAEIRAFAATASAVGDGFPSLAKDFYQSCMSQQRYIVAQTQDFRLDKFRDLSDPENELAKPGLTICKPYADEQGRLIKANATLVAYMRTIGDLSADQLTSFEKNLGALGGALADAKLLSNDDAAVVARLASYLARAATEGYRRKQLRTAIVDTNDDVKVLAAALQRIVAQQYVLQLENEREAMKAYYFKLAQETARFNRAIVKHAGGEAEVYDPLPLDAVKTSFEARNAALSTKIAGAKSYAAVMGEVAVGHQALRDSVDRLDAQATLQTVLSEAKTIQALAADFIEAF